MSLMTDIFGAIGMQNDHPDAQQHQNLMGSLVSLLGSQQSGGLQGLLQKLSAGGLGGAVKSWISTGQNQPITPDQLRSALGDEHINELAQNAGISPQKASTGLAALLPALVDKLSPNGQLHQPDTMNSMLSTLMQKMSSGPRQ